MSGPQTGRSRPSFDGAAAAAILAIVALAMCCQALPTTQATHGLLQGTPTAGIPSYLPLVERTSAGTKPPTPTSTPGPATLYTYRVVNTYPHDPGAFTQGLIYDEGTLYEGTGLRGRSSLRQVELETGQVIRSRQLADEYFGEGITSYSDQIFQLTWQSNVGFVWEEDTFELVQEFSYPTEGWGITHDGHRLIMSDGSATLHFWDPETLEEIGSVQVHDSGQPVERLNELEYIGGEVYANVWLTDRIARIDPETGGITGWVDLSGLLTPSERADADVLNGIAYDAVNDRLFVTGKWWPKLFEIELIPVSATPTT